MDAQELASKIDWEGGYTEAICGYGLGKADLDTEDPELRAAWDGAVVAGATFSQALVVLKRLMPEPEDG